MDDLILILGPCVIESADHAVRMAQRIRGACLRVGTDFIFKASFDKANRLSLGSYRGPGLTKGLRILQDVKEETGCRVLSDIHEAWQAAPAAEILDVIQIPALLCRQTDLIVAAARTGKPLNLKKGQFMAPEDMLGAIGKALSEGNKNLMLTERGTTFGYHNLVVDMRSIPIMKDLGFPVIMDATHAVQQPGGAGGQSSGRPEFIATIARAAVAAGADGVFLEVHDDPATAKSDGANSLPLKELGPLLTQLIRIREALCEQ
ncbi:MAG: 3-deoxy-8-phosphooctulonate synthase [Acidobacteria bacterium]|nr:3-deoxy-8-phosphooctulonate synthase [Acidobacteriota bacterium]